MNTTFQVNKNTTTDEWYTPSYIIEALGGKDNFDLDPSSPIVRVTDTAKNYYTKLDNGLAHEWFGRIFLNPPYSQPLLGAFIEKLSEHGNGIALLYNRTGSKMFQEFVLSKADAILFLSKRIHFVKPDGTQGDRPGCDSILVAYGADNVQLLKNSKLEGVLIGLADRYFQNGSRSTKQKSNSNQPMLSFDGMEK